uniref:Uncharacterized protein n=1 Tax=Lepeophtheirus salmonis TaxID=72036 RepID=A0A0K2V9B3_LEPSM
MEVSFEYLKPSLDVSLGTIGRECNTSAKHNFVSTDIYV